MQLNRLAIEQKKRREDRSELGPSGLLSLTIKQRCWKYRIGLRVCSVIELIRDQRLFHLSRRNYRVQINRDIHGVVCWSLVVLTLLLVPIFALTTGPDSVFYLEKGLDLYLGRGYDHPTRGPIFASILATAFSVLGPSAIVATIVVRTFFLLNVLMVWLLARQLFGAAAANCSVLLLLSAAFVHESTGTIGLDAVYPLFVLIGIYFSVVSFEHERIWPAIAAGASFGIAVLTKELALLHVVFPFAYLVFDATLRNSRRAWGNAAVQYLVCALAVTPWLIFLALGDDGVATMVGKGGPKNLHKLASLDGNSLIDSINFYLSGMPQFFQRYVARESAIWPLWAVAWVYMGFLAVRERSARALVVAIALFIPVMVAEGHVSIRIGQNHIAYCVSVIASGALLGRIIDYGSARVWPRFAQVCLYVMVVAISIYQLTTGRDNALNRIKGNSTSAFLLTQGTLPAWQVKGTLNDDSRRAAEWVSANLPEGEPIVADYLLFRSMYVQSGGRYPIYKFPYDNLDVQLSSQPSAAFKDGDNEGPLLFLWSHVRRDRFCNWQSSPCILFHTFYEGTFAKFMAERGARYVVLGARTWFLREYFDAHPAATLKQVISERIRIYSVDVDQSVGEFPLRVGEEVPRLLNKVVSEVPAAVPWFDETVLHQTLHLELIIADLVNGPSRIALFPKVPPL